jgi:hypothetical protein
MINFIKIITKFLLVSLFIAMLYFLMISAISKTPMCPIKLWSMTVLTITGIWILLIAENVFESISTNCQDFYNYLKQKEFNQISLDEISPVYFSRPSFFILGGLFFLFILIVIGFIILGAGGC